MNNIAEDKLDYNNFLYVEKNPISKVGIFPYLGRQISPEFEPNTVYYVYRPAEELFTEETMNSFKLVPIVDDHTMLGTDDGMIPAEKKGVHGTTGEEITHDDDTLYIDLKIFSEELKDKIKNGKKEISLGYYCDYDITSGEYNGRHYDAIQRNILGNHLALVKQGRMGSDVRVMDSLDLLTDFNNFTNNSKNEEMVDKRKDVSEIEAMLYEAKKDPSRLDDEFIKTILQKVENNSYEPSETSEADDEDVKDEDVETEKEETEKVDEKKEEVEDEDNEDTKSEDAKEGCDEDEDEDKKTVSMDEMFNMIAERDDLYNSVKKHTGEFNYKRMNSQQICKYACDCLNIKAEKGQEMATLKGYLQGRNKNEKRYGLDEHISFNNSKTDKAFEDYLK